MKRSYLTSIGVLTLALLGTSLQTAEAFDTTGCNQVFEPIQLRL
jgi:hypothetical protein